ncbi:arsinothricin resistance N-acetyltransferase ArsN1 family B [Natronorarus salvus]|uniref:arsinothricin resistance N-acetyltransferase ArsN1 family B n=1 Tax=Natronorarus salvus TaxID=3117733 RepID=UPI002F262767
MANSDDCTPIRRIYGVYVRETPISFELEVPSESEVRGRIEGVLERDPWLVCEHEGEVVGYAYATPFRGREAYQWSVESSVYVDDRYYRNGVARGLYESLFAILELQAYVGAFAGIALPNTASVGLHESMGFEPVGIYRNVGYKDGEWHDVGWWQRLIRSPPADPTPPRPVDEVRDCSGWDDALSAGASSIRL